MRSKASIKGHPIHPILVTFPIAFLTGSLLVDGYGVLSENTALHQTAYWMQITGVAFGLLAAIPGFIDYLFTVPPKSSGKKRATFHALINVTTLAIFTGIWFYRRDTAASINVVLAMEFIGLILLGIAGWMGGTLVYRNQIGVDMRYASAGKWKEESYSGKGKIEVADVDELKINQMKLLHINHQRIVLARTEKGYVAFDDHCPHRGGALSGGSLICGTVQCPWHGSQFDVTTGKVEAGPATDGIRTFSVVTENGKVFVSPG